MGIMVVIIALPLFQRGNEKVKTDINVSSVIIVLLGVVCLCLIGVLVFQGKYLFRVGRYVW